MKAKSASARSADFSHISFETLFRKHDAMMLILCGETGQIMDANDAALSFYGYSIKQITSLKIWDINEIPPDKRDAEWKQALRGKQKRFVRIHRMSNGGIRTVEIHTTPITQANRKYLFSIVQDITETETAKAAQQESEQQFKAIFNSTFQSTELLTPEGIVIEANNAALKSVGMTVKDATNKPIWKTPRWRGNEARAKQLKEAIVRAANGEFVRYEVKFHRAGNPTSVLDFSLKPIFDENGKVRMLVAEGRDISERKLMEQELRNSESNYRTLMEQASDAIFISDKDGNYTDANLRACGMFGYSREEILRLGMKDFLLPEEIVATPIRFQELRSGKTVLSERRMRRKDGSVIYTEISAKMLGDNRLLGIVRDITERKKMEMALRESEEKFSKAFKTSPDAININRFSDGKYLEINDGFTATTGYTPEDVLGRSSLPDDLGIWVNKKDRDRLLAGLRAKGEVVGFETPFRIKDGSTRLGSMSARIIEINGERCILSTTRDITNYRRMEQEIQKAQKLESLGILAGGIAHDFNNLLTGIFGYIALAEHESTEPKAKNHLSKASKTIDRARSLSGQLLTFAKGGEPIRKIDNLFPFVRETAQFALSGSNVSCHFDIPKDIWPCNYDQNQIGQVIDNIIINAQQAMPVGGTIELTARNISLTGC
jgi:PAS domain S-box-containing protein